MPKTASKLHKTLEWNMTKCRLKITPHNTKPEEERMCSRLINQQDWSHSNLIKVSLLFALSQFIKQMVIMISWIFKKWALQLPILNFPLKYWAIFQDTATQNSQNKVIHKIGYFREEMLAEYISHANIGTPNIGSLLSTMKYLPTDDPISQV